MNATLSKQRNRVRAKVVGSSQRPRLSVRLTNRHVVAQLVDDSKCQTLAYVSTVGAKLPVKLSERAAWAGNQIAEAALKHKLKQVVFDRGGRIYHGRLAALAEAARQKGLEF